MGGRDRKWSESGHEDGHCSGSQQGSALSPGPVTTGLRKGAEGGAHKAKEALSVS